jgi:hypothetical protein
MDFVKSGIRPDKERVLSVQEERFASNKIQELEKVMEGKETQQGLSFEPRDIQSVEKWLTHYKALKARGGATRFEGKERAQAEMELRRLVDAIAKKWGGKIPSWEEYNITPRNGGIRYHQLRDRIVKINKDREYAELIRRWKYVRRRMEPDDESADSVLHLFMVGR